MLPKTLVTERLVIRPFEQADARFIMVLLNEPTFIQNIGDKQIRSIDDAHRYLQQGPMASYQNFGFGLCCVQLKENGQPIGMCGILKRPELNQPDLGYALLPHFTRQGYAREGAQAVLREHAQQFDLQQILAVTKPSNLASRRLLEGTGFVEHGEIELYGSKNCLYGFRVM